MCLFIACDFSEETLARTSAIAKELRNKLRNEPIRWVSPELYHLTLQFLGDVPENKIKPIEAIIAAVSEQYPRLPVRLSGAGCFPSLRNAQTIWLGLDTNQQLNLLVADLRAGLKPLGFADDSTFKPHLTLGRLNRDASNEQKARVAAQILAIKAFQTELDYFNEIILYKSVLTPSGPIYTALSRFSLKSMLN